MDTQCPWCGEELGPLPAQVAGKSYPFDVAMEEHATECAPLIAEQGEEHR